MLKSYFDTRPALGGIATIVLVADEAEKEVPKVVNHLWREIYMFERRFSRFIPESELSRFNRSAGINKVCSPEFISLLEASMRMSRVTEGLYNPFVLPAVQRAGYKGSALKGYENDTVDDFSDRAVVGFEKLTINGDKAQIPYGTALDMGGCGKGFLVDLLASYLDEQSINGYWISLSGDLVVKGLDANERPWKVVVQTPTSSKEEVVLMTDGEKLAVATSGTYNRPNQKTMRSKKSHHIINPTTGLPASTDINLATVCARSCLEADVLASTAVILGSKRAQQILNMASDAGLIVQSKSSITTYGNARLIRIKKSDGVVNVA